jgi:coatomer protein complex subunit alpha (xenin)
MDLGTNLDRQAEHAAAGAVESAARLLHAQLGIVNFAPLKPTFVALRAAAGSCARLEASSQSPRRSQSKPSDVSAKHSAPPSCKKLSASSSIWRWRSRQAVLREK